MSCNTAVPINDIADKVIDYLDLNFIPKDDPRIAQGVFIEPTIRGGLVVDTDTKAAICEIVQDCGAPAPHGKMWVNIPLSAGLTLISYVDGEDIKVRWEMKAPTPSEPSAARPTGNTPIGMMHFDTSLASAGKPIWWSGTVWVDSDGSVV